MLISVSIYCPSICLLCIDNGNERIIINAGLVYGIGRWILNHVYHVDHRANVENEIYDRSRAATETLLQQRFLFKKIKRRYRITFENNS